MNGSHREEAMDLQRRALQAGNNFGASRKRDRFIANSSRLTNYSSRYGRRFIWPSDESAYFSDLSIHYQKKISRLYESAGDEWVQQAGEKINLRDIKNSLSYAISNYELSVKLVETIKEENRILKKVSSIKATMENLIL